jgi:HNH endonuclease
VDSIPKTKPETEHKIIIVRRFKKTDFCLKCGCRDKKKLTWHHVIPKVHLKSENAKADLVTFCRDCHDKMEYYILSVESFIGKVSFGERFKLRSTGYYMALINFLGLERSANMIKRRAIHRRKKRRRSKKRT